VLVAAGAAEGPKAPTISVEGNHTTSDKKKKAQEPRLLGFLSLTYLARIFAWLAIMVS
jgi:hypothetical protein